MRLEKLVPAAPSLALVPSLAACGNPSGPSGSTPPGTNPSAAGLAVPDTEAPAVDDSLQKVLDAGELTTAAEGNWVPYVYSEDGTGELTSFEMDIAKEIYSCLGMESDLQTSSSQDPVEVSMDSGRYDYIICGVNPKPERQEKHNMSITYIENPFCLAAAGNSEEITGFANLASGNRANAPNSTAGDLARKAGAKLPGTPLTAVTDLIVSGRIDAIVSNVTAIEEYVKERPDMNAKIAATYEPEKGEEWIIQPVVAFQKSADTLTRKVNEILQEMIDDGICYSPTAQYFGQSMANSISIYQK